MVSKTNEQALEAAIERSLAGISSEEMQSCVMEFMPSPNHFLIGHPRDFDKQYALDCEMFWAFLEATQATELDKLKKSSPNDWQMKILVRFDRMMSKHGILHLLKKGLDLDDIHLTFMFPAPLASSSEKVKKNFKTNVFSVTRQLHYSLTNPLEEIDMVLFLNGIPLITLELKNPWTGQNAKFHGIKQYKEDRDTKQTLFHFARCLVHMAVDTDEVYMTTKLAGKSTFFLPFNKGFNEGKGNPPNPNGHKTAYLWREVFSKESIANIIQHFVRLDGSPRDPLAKRTLFFPRYHQLDVVRKLVAHCAKNGVGHTYLIQHSAGSGKSNSITWAAYQLIETYPVNATICGSHGVDVPLFDSVIVVTDRRLLDRQLRDNIKEFSEVKNIIAPAQKSSELKAALESGKKIIITTIQKFPFIIDGISDLSDRRFAVIIDEAHGSQDGSSHDKMNSAMGGKHENKNAEQEGEEDNLQPEDNQDKILTAMRSRKMRGNASYFAFTATPKNSTLEKFGEKQADGEFKPFHLYSMKQAIEEGFILDVLANYTTYKSFYEIEKSILENPEFESQKAQKRLRAYVEGKKETIAVKAEIMLEHFIHNVVNPKKLKGKAKGMIVTKNIETAIQYYLAIREKLQVLGNPFEALIAFSGKKTVGGVEYTESDLNGFPDSDTKDYFDVNFKRKSPTDPIPKHINQDKYKLLIVANKYLTGFDQPKLSAMYIDKKLTGVLCVQTLSRLNRSASKYGKKTEDLFVLDFFNEIKEIEKSFSDYYTSTTLSKETDVNVLHDVKATLDSASVYEWSEVEDFNQRFFDGEDAERLSPLIDICAARFDEELEFEHKDKVAFKVQAKQFVKVYGQMASIMRFEIVNWEKLFWFLKFLIPKLNVKQDEDKNIDALLESVDLTTYGLQRVKLNEKIELDDSETALDPQNPNVRGGQKQDEEIDPLDLIIKTFNERWFQGWSATPEEQRVKLVNISESIKAHPDFELKFLNNTDPHNRELAFDKIFKEVMLKRRREELELYKLLASDEAFKESMVKTMQSMVSL